jgi:hypothetical protein
MADDLQPWLREKIEYEKAERMRQLWDALQAFGPQRTFFQSWLPSSAKPQLTPRPIELCAMIGQFAVLIFSAEDQEVLVETNGSERRQTLKEDVVSRINQILTNVINGNAFGYTDLAFHAPIEQILEEARKSLNFHINSLAVREIRQVEHSSLAASVFPSKLSLKRTLAERMNDAALGIGHEALAQKIGISKTSYFYVKSGRSGKKSKRIVELYLDKLELR